MDLHLLIYVKVMKGERFTLPYFRQYKMKDASLYKLLQYVVVCMNIRKLSESCLFETYSFLYNDFS
jgi:hypothetical protein